MKRIFFVLIVLIGTSPIFSQISFNRLLDAFSETEYDEFHSYLGENKFSIIEVSPNGKEVTWALGYLEDTKKADIILKTKISPVKSIWIESYGSKVYIDLETEIRKNCESRGMYGCQEVEYWESFEHISGISFKLIQYPDSAEQGYDIIEVLE